MKPTISSATGALDSSTTSFPAGKQRRLRGRMVPPPNLDLCEVAMHAVVDGVALEVHVPRPTQFPHLQKVIAERIHYKPHVEAIDPGAGGRAQLFRVTLQDPNRDRLLGAEAAIREKYGEDATVSVSMLEVALDARPRSKRGPSLAQLTQHLGQHFLPSPEIISGEGARPRQAYSRGQGKTKILGHRGGYEAAINGRGTTYYGTRQGPVCWRAYLKTQDSLDNGIGRALPADRHSARLEVTIRGRVLLQLGITSLESLIAFRFERLKHFFQFFNPTFPQSEPSGEPSVSASIERWRNRYRQRLATECGVWALLELDLASNEHRRRVRAGIPRLGRRGTRVRPLGGTGHLKAYDAMNQTVRGALRACRL